MTTESIILQEILLPTTPEMEECEKLFFREGLSQELPKDRMTPEDYKWAFSVSNGTITRDDRMLTSMKRHALEALHPIQGVRYDNAADCLLIPAGHLADLSCYLNMISAKKWLETTYVENITLELDIQGNAHIDVISYYLDDFDNVRQVGEFNERRGKSIEDESLELDLLASDDWISSDCTVATFPIGHPDATLVGIVITAKTDVKLYGGRWVGQIDQHHIRDVDLCISTTTFHKEEFIARNIASIKQMLSDYPEMANHFHMIVIDNGRTLNAASFEDEHVSVFGNINAGGSGGFARGMIEAMRMERKPTHLLLMDDDVLVITESIRRTFTLLKLLKPEYQHHFLSGAMLRLEYKDVQYEDIGFIHRDGFYASKKSIHSLCTIIDCACNEIKWPDFGYEYAGWWFCCIPFEYISEKNLPVPFFIKGDDAEYCLRNNAKVLTLNGICVWHMGFTEKFTASMDYYQIMRNSLILQAFNPKRQDIRFFGMCEKIINQLLNTFAYDYADFVLDAIEDFLQGPAIIEKPNGIDVLQSKAPLNEQLEPITQIWQGSADFDKLFNQPGYFSFRSNLLRRVVNHSFNGQLRLRSLESNRVGFTPNGWDYDPRTFFMAKSILVVSPVGFSAFERKRNPERFNEVVERKNMVFKHYRKLHEEIEESYRNAFPRLTSIDFWKDYLGIE